MPVSLEIKGLKELTAKLDKLGKLDYIKPAIKAAAAHIKGKVNIYPPATEANSPSNDRWYERGYGPKWRRKDGSIGSKKTSQTLGRKWTIAEVNGGFGAIVGNNVTYGPYVQDPEEQASFHAAHGWKTTEQVVEEEQETVTRFVIAAIEKQIES